MTQVIGFDAGTDIPPCVRDTPAPKVPEDPIGYLNDRGIRWAIENGEIVIKNHRELGYDLIAESITPVGYDLRVGSEAVSSKKGVVHIDTTKPLKVYPGEHVVVWTAEDIRLGRRIGATIHSRVGLVSKGFSHISTTIDPTWPGNRKGSENGNLGIHLVNLLDEAVFLHPLERLCTVVFFRATWDSLKSFEAEIHTVEQVHKELVTRSKKAKKRRIRVTVLLWVVSLLATGVVPYLVLRFIVGWPQEASLLWSGWGAALGGMFFSVVFNMFWERR